MPEGDTVWNTARQLRHGLAGRTLTGSEFRVPALATEDLTGWTVLDVVSRGKHLLLRLRADVPPADDAPARPAEAAMSTADGATNTDAGATNTADGGSGRRWTLHSHLRMDGVWRVYPAGARWAARPAHLIRVVLRTADAAAVGYHLHDVALRPTADEADLVGHLGPDLLGPDWDPDEAVRRLSARPDRPITAALLDQRNLAGVGNLYQAELLFLRGVWPWTPVAATPDLPGLVALAHRLLAANRGRWTQSTTGSLRRGETTYVYGRRGRPCRRCGTPIEMDDRGERVIYWCPRCQPPRS